MTSITNFLNFDCSIEKKISPAAATGFDRYLLRVSAVEELPDSVVLKEPAAIVEADVVV